MHLHALKFLFFLVMQDLPTVEKLIGVDNILADVTQCDEIDYDDIVDINEFEEVTPQEPVLVEPPSQFYREVILLNLILIFFFHLVDFMIKVTLNDVYKLQ
jgi:hypothetical protein